MSLTLQVIIGGIRNDEQCTYSALETYELSFRPKQNFPFSKLKIELNYKIKFCYPCYIHQDICRCLPLVSAIFHSHEQVWGSLIKPLNIIVTKYYVGYFFLLERQFPGRQEQIFPMHRPWTSRIQLHTPTELHIHWSAAALTWKACLYRQEVFSESDTRIQCLLLF